MPLSRLAPTAATATSRQASRDSRSPTTTTDWPLPRGTIRSTAGTPVVANSSMGSISACFRPSSKTGMAVSRWATAPNSSAGAPAPSTTRPASFRASTPVLSTPATKASASPPLSPDRAAMRRSANAAASSSRSASSSRQTTQSGDRVSTTVPSRPFASASRVPGSTSAPPTPAVSRTTTTPGSLSRISPTGTWGAAAAVAKSRGDARARTRRPAKADADRAASANMRRSARRMQARGCCTVCKRLRR
mmetsp:Transcript_16582/g.57183  ORF Transcript_16582/g.57183 Transcript_16582/m.57183 type:complete len:248 (-) Transcript_16582:5-748(-)